MNLYIIGNGFDKGHGLATSYWDFRTYLERMYPRFLNSFEERYYIYPGKDITAKQQMLWNELETNLANIVEDVIIEDAVGIDMGLESGDVGIYDTLYQYLTDEYKYINQLTKYLKQWVRTIKIRDVQPKTTLINKDNDALYITFNYTALLETVYEVRSERIIHIHGSLRQLDDDPLLGHGNDKRIHNIQLKRKEAEQLFAEKEISIYRVIGDYYNNTYKDIKKHMPKLSRLSEKTIDNIIIIGHSLAGVDIPYFQKIDFHSKHEAKWKVYYYSQSEKQRMLNSLIECGIEPECLEMTTSNEFYNL